MNANLPAASARRSLRGLFLTLALAAATLARATVAELPPHYPDAGHVYNGCHLSTLSYLARFTAEFPAETGRPIVVNMRNADNRVRSHTMSLITWHGAYWIRDEYFGVFSLECTPQSGLTEARLVARAEELYARHARAAMRDARLPKPTFAPTELDVAARKQVVETAASVVPFAHTIFWVKDGAREVPVMFFRPAKGVIAVYDPIHGTAVAECASRDDAKITSLVATTVMGYRGGAIRADLPEVRGALVAAVNAN